MGIMTLGVALLDTRGLGGSIVYAMGHGLAKAALFLLAGTLLHSLRTVDEIELQGRGPRAVGLVWLVAALALAGLPPFGTFVGDEGILDAARSGGHGWIGIVTAFAEVMTAGAALRVGGRVFLGWGPRVPEVGEGGGKPTEEPETEETRDVPWSMVVSAVVTVALSLAVGLVPHVRERALAAAATMQDTHAYTARVLGGGPVVQHVFAPAPGELGVGRAIAIAAGAAALAFVTLFRQRIPDALRAPVRLVVRTTYRGLRAAHTGHVADYVTWLVVGLAAIGVVSELAMRG
jgi:multicomponent Na+:H+ antiporter subunit D